MKKFKLNAILASCVSSLMLMTMVFNPLMAEESKESESSVQSSTVEEAKTDSCCESEANKEEKSEKEKKHAYSKPELDPSHEKTELSEWEGEYPSYLLNVKDEKERPALEELAKKYNTTVEDILKDAEVQFGTDFDKIKFEGDKISFIKDNDGKEEVDSHDYEFDGAYKAKFGDFEYYWFVYKAKEDLGDHTYLALTEKHGEEVMLHFHLRYAKDIDGLFDEELEKKNWWPTFVDGSVTPEMVMEAFVQHYQPTVKIPEAEVQSDVKLSDWNGEWNSMGAYLDKEELQVAFETLAKNENKEVSEVKEAYVQRRAADFNGLIIKDDKISFYTGFPTEENATAEAENTYTYLESYKVKHGHSELEWDVFKANEEDAKYPLLMLMPIHGEETLTHFHMRYGASVEEMFAKKNWYPTFVAPDTTDDQLIDEITE